MKKGKFSTDQIAKILKEFEQGKSVEDITREHGISRASFYKWRQRYGGMEASELRRVKELKMGSLHDYAFIQALLLQFCCHAK